jgi:hypothetical protein
MIKSREDAEKYIREIQNALLDLSTKSIEAGLNRHAAIFLALAGAFINGPKEIETWEHMTEMYLKAVLKKEGQDDLQM